MLSWALEGRTSINVYNATCFFSSPNGFPLESTLIPSAIAERSLNSFSPLRVEGRDRRSSKLSRVSGYGSHEPVLALQLLNSLG
jgi:hypothetical protein